MLGGAREGPTSGNSTEKNAMGAGSSEEPTISKAEQAVSPRSIEPEVWC